MLPSESTRNSPNSFRDQIKRDGAVEHTELDPDDITVGERARSLNRDVVDKLKLSIPVLGLITPISVRFLNDDDGWILVAGRHRLQACVELGWPTVPVRVEPGTERDQTIFPSVASKHSSQRSLPSIDADWRKTRFPQTIGEEFPAPGTADFQRTPSFSVH